MKVLTSVGRWEYMRLRWQTRIHAIVTDATGHRYVITGVRRGR